MNGLATAKWNEIVIINTYLQRSLVAVERRTPRVFWIGCFSPTTVLPDHPEVIETESCGLRIGDVCFTPLVDEDSSGGCDSRGPAQIQHPAGHVEHMDAHVADDSIAVFHERAPGARM